LHEISTRNSDSCGYCGSLLRWREALLHGLEALAHFLKKALELFESLLGRDILTAGIFSGFFVGISGTGIAARFSIRGFLQTRNLSFDHGRHFDDEVVALLESFVCENGGGIASSSYRLVVRHSVGVVRLRDISGTVIVTV